MGLLLLPVKVLQFIITLQHFKPLKAGTQDTSASDLPYEEVLP